jgi:hypothetical protein
VEAKFVIDGAEYPVPELESFDMDELQIMYDYCGFAREDLLPADPNASEDELAEHITDVERKLRHPGVWRTMLHVAYRRAHPTEKDARIRELTGKVNLLDALGEIEEEQSPPATSSQSEPSSDSDTKPLLPSEASGRPSSNGSEEPDKSPASIGTSGSVTSSQPSAPTVSGD